MEVSLPASPLPLQTNQPGEDDMLVVSPNLLAEEREELSDTLSPPRQAPNSHPSPLLGAEASSLVLSPIISRSQAHPGPRRRRGASVTLAQEEPREEEANHISDEAIEDAEQELSLRPSASPELISETVSPDVERQGDTSAVDFQDGPAATDFEHKDDLENDGGDAGAKVKKKSKGKKRKATESVDDDNEDGSCCTICFEKWTNSGEHRIASMKCGHFFGFHCIEKWLRSSSSCPNCNEKSTKKDLRVHYVAKLAAIDTGERDRALADLEKTRTELRELQLRHTELQVRLKLQQDKIDRMETVNRGVADLPHPPATQLSGGAQGGLRLVYQRRHEVCRPSQDRDKTCRILAYSQYHGMLVISQPGANPLFPGYGVRRFNLLDQRLGNYVHLAKEVIRDLAFHPSQHELLLSCGQGKEARITNISSCQEVARFSQLDTEAWACDWGEGGHTVYLGTKRGQLAVLDTRAPTSPPTTIPFQGTERRPIIGLRSVPACQAAGFPFPGVLLLTLGSLWFWEIMPGGDTVQHRLQVGPPEARFWSLSYDPTSRLVLVVTKPSPQSSHLVLELVTTRVSDMRVVTCNTVTASPGGSYSARSFLRSALVPCGGAGGQVLLVHGRGTGPYDHKVTVKEVGTDRIQQEVNIGRPVLDVKAANINGVTYLAVLGETDLTMFRWE